MSTSKRFQVVKRALEQGLPRRVFRATRPLDVTEAANAVLAALDRHDARALLDDQLTRIVGPSDEEIREIAATAPIGTSRRAHVDRVLLERREAEGKARGPVATKPGRIPPAPASRPYGDLNRMLGKDEDR